MGLCQSVKRKEVIKIEGANITIKKEEAAIQIQLKEFKVIFLNLDLIGLFKFFSFVIFFSSCTEALGNRLSIESII